jgi:two-component sensor histidine kinase
LRIDDHFYEGIVHVLPEHIAVLDSRGQIVATNTAWDKFAAENGATNLPKVGVGANYLEVCRRAIVDRDEYAAKALHGIEAVLCGQLTVFTMDYPCHSPHELRWFSMNVVSFNGAGENGVVIAHSNVSTRTLNAKEVSHRSKNLLNLVQAIALQTIKANPEDFAHRFSDRLRSLASTQDLLFSNIRGNVSLPELVSSQLGHFSQATGNRFAIKGPYILLNSRAAQALGMALHELGTNAAKYGAFANDSGCIRLKWNVEPAKRRFTMSWVERGGPPVQQPARRGFGSSLLAEAIELTLKASVTLKYEAAGLSWHISCDAHDVLIL